MDFPKVEQPKDLNIGLFNHQLTSIYYMENLEETKRVRVSGGHFLETHMGIFGDIPGYGKSLSIVGLILNDKMEWDLDTKYQRNIIEGSSCYGEFIKFSTIKLKKINPTLLVGPSSVIPQWEEYFKYAPSLKTKTILRVSQIEDLSIDNINDYDVIIAIPTMFSKITTKFANYAWKRFIYDEPNSTEIPNFKYIYAGFSWYISATYDELKYMSSRSRNYLNVLFKNIDPYTFESIIIKNDVDYIRSSFVMPSVRYITHQCINPQLVGVLKNHVSSNIIEMINAGDIQSVIKSLGGSENSNIVELVTKKHKEDLQRAMFSLNFYKERDGEESDSYKRWEKSVDEIKEKIKDIETRFKEMQEGECPICRCDITTPVMIPCCQNIFCSSCLLGWCHTKSSPTCPMCRHPVEYSNWVYLKEKENDIAIEVEKVDDDKPLSKPDTVVKIIKELQEKKSDPKIIIFSSWDETFNIISRFLSDAEIDFHELKGHISSRKKIINEYKKGQSPILFLNSRFNGAGINLQETTDIILYHEMPDGIKTQILGRANRIGRKDSLNVHLLIG
jgi:hypothetical protein